MNSPLQEMRRLSADMHRGQRASLGNQTDHAIKAGYKGAADFFATRHEFFLLSGRHPYKTLIAIEMKCYRTIAASGGTRGAHDIFMKDVYKDLHILEEYVAHGHASRGVALVMNDLERFVNPKVKNGKCWAYDISQGHTFPGGQISVPIGGKDVQVDLQNSYTFDWTKFGGLWFLELEGVRL